MREWLKHLVDHGPILQHEYLQRMRTGALTPDQLKGELLERYWLARTSFVPFMAEIMANTSPVDEHVLAVRAMLAKNLYEETGAGNPNKSHVELWHRLLSSVGHDVSDLDPISFETGVLTQRLVQIGREKPTPYALGAFTYASEYFVIGEYGAYLSACRSVFPDIEEADMVQLSSHVLHDPRHTDEAVAVLDLYRATDPGFKLTIEDGALAGLVIRKDYFDARLQTL